ncbi:hypothetical protein [Terrabacter terrigena]|uniref:Phosphotransferase n=1 Tax=Terrabacter terrigena TaxID=574718 RepID=A0ABW3N4X1_9MICO
MSVSFEVGMWSFWWRWWRWWRWWWPGAGWCRGVRGAVIGWLGSGGGG